MIFVPIDLPTVYERAVKSAARRALGPSADVQERSGVNFTMRCIGARTAEADPEQEKDADDAEDDDEMCDDTAAGSSEMVSDMPLEALNKAQLRKQFGRSALDMVGAMFQHQSKIGESARFMNRRCHEEALGSSL